MHRERTTGQSRNKNGKALFGIVSLRRVCLISRESAYCTLNSKATVSHGETYCFWSGSHLTVGELVLVMLMGTNYRIQFVTVNANHIGLLFSNPRAHVFRFTTIPGIFDIKLSYNIELKSLVVVISSLYISAV